MKLKKALSIIWLIGFENMVIAEAITYATPKILQAILNTVGGKEFSLKELLFLVLFIEASVATFFICRLLKGKINKLNNILGAGITLLVIIKLESMNSEYWLFAIIETACMVSIIILCFLLSPKAQEDSTYKIKKSDFS
ncbi:hypothetical protein EV198_1908 [Roseivirga ehrenbergii]|uniref:DUF2127 domain-containing protein n=1 Tax=Roseivirga ehrenbergii (strain DSM 102268 / JCM 13514 / KCTC 12282 / NCIMB 14502 / KMM 6017) TaxID=279360 RepID=A0A150XSG1_ROSEK|nr:hypothetical protein [Roseivirga ehrenbergii]KYG81699.1 hypothetical protein MB14_14050 [Roseivirga ehrenbergii]TCL10876.1 hypothetical protein EV198_1908 [Roseivirga ehrenbergii]